MDTSSHICMGVATGLVVANIATNNNIDINTTSIVGFSIAANVFPDIDVLFKLKSRDAYISNHRGMSHSFLFAVIWIMLLTLIGSIFYPDYTYIYFIIALIGIVSHITTDLFNGYGVQFLWPLSHRWIALGITYTFDALFIILNIISFILIFIFKFDTLITLITTYSIFLVYIFISFLYQIQLRKLLINKYGKYKRMILQAKATPINWKYVYETTDGQFYMGIIRKRDIIELRNEKRQSYINKELELSLSKNKELKSFLDFTPIFNYDIRHKEDGSMVIKFYDLRYLMVKKNDQYYTFNCFVLVKDNVVLSSYIGFTVNHDNAVKRFKKELEKNQ